MYGKFSSTGARGIVSIQALAVLNIYYGGSTEISRQALSEFLHNMSNQALNKDNYNGFMQFDRRGELINESIFMFLDRNNTSLNTANAINNNINNQINNDQFTFDVPAETEIQKIWKIYQKTEKPTNTASSLCLPRLLTEKEIEIERDKANKEFIKTSLLMSKDQLDAANEPAGQKN